MKIIPAIDLMDGKVVRLYKGNPNKKTIYSTQPVEVAKKWEKAGADMLHLVDLDATLGKGTNQKIIKTLINQVNIPVQVAGGLRDETIISTTLEFASRIVIGTLAFQQKDLLKKIFDNYGKDRIVISVDHIDGKIMVEGWQKHTEQNIIESINNFVHLGFSEFLMTNVSRDGTLLGPDLKFLHEACKIKNINVISSGGISKIDDIVRVKEQNAFGVILGKALYENLVTIEEAKKIA